MSFKLSLEKTVDLSCSILIILIFISKISFKWTNLIPYSIPPFIFQYGLHPYINFGLQFFIALILVFIWIKKYHSQRLSSIYNGYIYGLMILLTIQTLFQITLININSSILIQLAGLGMALMLILIYGVIIPTLFDLDKFIFLITRLSVFLVIASLITLPLFFHDMFRGGRFIGFFKHIPHMVSASTAAYIFFFPTLFTHSKWTLKNNTPLKIIILFLLFISVALTSTKAAFVTVIITSVVGIFIFGTKNKSFRLFKFSFLASSIIAIILIGAPASQFFYEIATGKIALGLRKAQNGVEERTEEVTRGLSMFETSPYFGHGLLYKFLNNKQEGIEVESYNSFKDPHNLFVSSAVIGGYPLIVFAVIGYILMIIGAIKGLNQNNPNRQIIGLFLLAHLPVFVIYHAHFSLGGIADRLYWMIFGYIGQKWGNKNEIKTNVQGSI